MRDKNSAVLELGALMPLPPLLDPERRRDRIRGLSRGVPVITFLGSTLLGFNALQTASLAVRPVSRHTFRKLNRSLGLIP